MSEWLLVITVMWGSPIVGGEGKYMGGPYRTIEACVSEAPRQSEIARRKMTVSADNTRVVRVECVLRDYEASH